MPLIRHLVFLSNYGPTEVAQNLLVVSIGIVDLESVPRIAQI